MDTCFIALRAILPGDSCTYPQNVVPTYVIAILRRDSHTYLRLRVVSRTGKAARMEWFYERVLRGD